MARDAQGGLWIGSNSLTRCIGGRCEQIAVPRAYAFRALAPDRVGRVWVGAVGAIGFVSADATGLWTFTSLNAELAQSGAPPPGDVWQAHAAGDGAIFVSSEWAHRWNGKTFDHWRLPSTPRLLSFPGEDAALIYQSGVGLLRLRATGDPTLEIADAEFPAKPITWIAPLAGGNQFFGLGDQAFRRENDGRFVPLSELSATLRGSLPFAAARLRDGSLAIGTLRQGIVFASSSGEAVTRAPFPDDTVYSFFRDTDDAILTGLAEGARVTYPPRQVLALATPTPTRGAPLHVFDQTGKRFLVTEKGVWISTTVATNRLLVDAPRIWDATMLGDELWVAAFGGVWRIRGAESVLEHHTAGDAPLLTPTAHAAHGLVFLDGYNLKLLQLGEHGWFARDLAARAGDTPLSLLEDARGELWISTIFSGIDRLQWTDGPEPQLRLVGRYYEGHGLPNGATHPRLTIVGSRVFAFCRDTILALNTAGTAFEPAPEFADFIGLQSTSATTPGTSAYWLVQARDAQNAPPALIRVGSHGERVHWEPVHAPGIDSIGPITSLDRSSDTSETALWLGGRDRVIRVPETELATANLVPPLRIDQFTTDQARFATATPLPALNATTHEVTARFSASSGDRDAGLRFQTRLDGVESSWTAPSAETSRVYTGLRAGRYTLHARAVDRFGRVGPALSFPFAVAQPWFATPWAWGAYLLVAVGIGAGLTRARARALRRQNERLNQLVAERTRELELSNTAKSEFLENISHEIRNPLQGLTGMLDLLDETELKPKEREVAQSVKACADRLSRVSEEVLQYSKLEYGYVTVQPVPFSARTLLEDIAELFAAEAQRAKSRIVVELPDDFRDGFVGDEAKIRTILHNFVANALKYAPGAPIELRADTAEAVGGMVDLYFEVTDFGPGVAPDEQELIFQKFVRGSSAKANGAPGTGLGLATCRALAKAINGSVGVESLPGRGSTFYLRALVARANGTEIKTANTSTPRREKRGGRALIVEDERYNQTVLRGITLQLGFEPTVAANAAEARAALEIANFDVVFLDWELPGQKGVEIARYARTLPHGAHAVIVATTAHDSEEIRQRCREAGMNAFLLKPYTKQQIERAIAHAGPGLRSNNALTYPKTEAAPSSETDLSLEAFEWYARGTGEASADALGAYIAAVEDELHRLNQAQTQLNASQISYAAHRLRALAGSVGARALGQAAAHVEQLAAQPERAEFRDAVEAVSARWAELKLRLNRQR